MGTIILSGNKTSQAQPISLVIFWGKLPWSVIKISENFLEIDLPVHGSIIVSNKKNEATKNECKKKWEHGDSFTIYTLYYETKSK
jgi:hypothetical protein